jgi:hypothetical protein
VFHDARLKELGWILDSNLQRHAQIGLTKGETHDTCH